MSMRQYLGALSVGQVIAGKERMRRELVTVGHGKPEILETLSVHNRNSKQLGKQPDNSIEIVNNWANNQIIQRRSQH